MDTYFELFQEEEEEGEEDIDIEQFKGSEKLVHDPIYEEFEISEFSCDRDNEYFFKNGKLWADAKYKNFRLKNFQISEDMFLYSKARKGIVPDNAGDMTGKRRTKLSL